ncbi:MAG: hypothetical protein M3Y39_11235 [Chloroflexota bacterium]|nr:hypothetical protein [Chloroflexota bacterium]
MPKKTTASRSGAQRNRPRAQKNIEVVRQPASVTTTEQEPVTDEQTEKTLESYATTPAPAATTARSTTRTAAKTKTVTPEVREEPPVEQENPVVPTAPKGSAAARLAARRQGQRSQLRSSATLITAEHYTYVKRDLVTIAILASFMFVAIIVLYLILARGF